jgi:ParB family chromosome partitioning protein
LAAGKAAITARAETALFPVSNDYSERSTAMTETIDAAQDGLHPGDTPPPDGTSDLAGRASARAVIATVLLTAHPGNVRHDVSLDQEFLDSITELGILTPLRITPDGSGGYRVIEGHRRLAAAEKLGLTEVPYDLAADRERDEAGQFLDMYAVNHHRKGLTALEEADALFGASANGATKTRIRKSTGLDKEQVTAALAAGKLGGTARDLAHSFGYAITLDQLALLAEFDGDEAAVVRLTNAFCDGNSGVHVAERIRQERAEAAEHEQLLAQLTADGYAVTDSLPAGAHMLHLLLQDEQELTPEAHAGCPGRGVYFFDYQPLNPQHYCTDPAANGHSFRYQPTPLPDLSKDRTGPDGGSQDPDQAGSGLGGNAGGSQPPDPGRRLVIEGNKAWAAACTVRKRWIADVLLQRRSAPKDAMPFIAAQLLAMPPALRDAIAFAPKSVLFGELTKGTFAVADVAAWPAGRLPLALLAVIATAYEDRMSGDAGRETWRTDRPFPRCSRADAGGYFRFLASIGYELSAIEQSVADGIPYTGDEPQEEASEPQGDSDSSETAADDPAPEPDQADAAQSAAE